MNQRKILISVIILIAISTIGITIFRSKNRMTQMPASLKSFAETDQITYPLAVWEWRSPTQFEDLEIETIASILNKTQVQTIFIDISEVVDLKDDGGKSSDILHFNQKLGNYIQIMNQHQIQVQGLTGNKNWSDPSYQYLTKIALDYVQEYNLQAAANQKLAGIQFDIEPFSTPEFTKNPNIGLLDFIQMTKDTISHQQELNQTLAVGFALPYWLDGQNSNLDKLNWQGKTAYPFYHLSDELAAYKNSYIVLMSYRNYAQGEDGSIALSKNEIDYDQQNNLNTIIGQELNDEQPAKITFFKKNMTDLFSQLMIINQQFKNVTIFKGIALHEVKSLVELMN